MRSYNRIFLIGNCAAEPVLGNTKNGKNYLYFPIAIERDHKPEEGSREVDFHKITVWGTRAESLEPLIKKGNRLFITGKLVNHKYEDSQENTKYATEVNADQIEVLTFKQNTDESSKISHNKELTTA